LLRRNAFETNDGRNAGPKFDHFVVNAFELPGVAARALAEGVKVFESVRGDGQLFVPCVNFVQGETVALNFLLGTIFGTGVAKNERTQAVGGDSDAFNAVGGFSALNKRHFTESFKHLWRLVGEQFLFAFGLGNIIEQPRGAHGQGVVTETLIAEGHHGSSGLVGIVGKSKFQAMNLMLGPVSS
jgi:hypothetical protein